MEPNTIGGGPYLAAALFCSEVRVDENGLHSVINLIDELTFTGPRPSPSDYGQVRLYLRFVRGDFEGDLPLSLVLLNPDESTDRQELPPATFHEPDVFHYVIAAVNLPLYQPGVLWCSLMLGDRLMTRVRLHLRHRPAE